MYSIGKFSEICNVPVKTLRYYDDIGLLTPSYIDPITNYRYYDYEKIQVMKKIILLKSCQFSLTTIYETYDGAKAVKKTDLDYLIATNHALFPEIESLEIGRLAQSQIRFNVLERKMSAIGKRSVGELKELLFTEFPDGLSVHNYQENFGTVHSALFNLTDCQLEFSFGSPMQNKIYKIGVGDNFSTTLLPVKFQNREYGTDFWRVSK
ncbi:MerR family transcriptional regulator [Microbacteriaceae bacterium 4G12]